MIIKERNIPRLANRPDSMRVGMDPGNMEPIEMAVSGKQSNANVHMDRSDKLKPRGQTYPQHQMAHRGGGMERGRSRSRSKSRETLVNVSDLKELKETHAHLREAEGGVKESANEMRDKSTDHVSKYGTLNRTGKNGADQGGKYNNKSI